MNTNWLIFDSNSLRNKGKVDSWLSKPENRAVIIDTLIYESAAVSNPSITFIKNFENLTQYADRCDLAYDLSYLMKTEKVTKKPARSIIDNEASIEFRKVLKSLSSSQNAVEPFLKRLSDIGKKEKIKREKAGRAKAQLLNMIAAIKTDFSITEQKGLRSLGQPGIVRQLSSISATITIHELLKSNSYSDKAATSLCANMSVSFAYTFSMMAMAFYWFHKGGYDQRESTKFQNDFFDIEYITFASLFPGKLISIDKNQVAILKCVSEGLIERDRLFNEMIKASLLKNSNKSDRKIL